MPDGSSRSRVFEFVESQALIPLFSQARQLAKWLVERLFVASNAGISCGATFSTDTVAAAVVFT